MPRIALVIEYSGSAFHGWQRQQDLPSVQATLEDAIQQIVNHPVMLVAAGRTDAGVHALNMVAHFDTEKEYPKEAFTFGVNHFLPTTIRVHEAYYLDENFHARFCATYRRYHFLILNTPTSSPLLVDRVLWHPIPLNTAAMQLGANFLLGEHDFSSFRGKDCQAKSPVKIVHFCQITHQGHLIKVDIQANGFLHHMVRNIIGVLLKIGEGRRAPTWMQEVLAAKDRTAAGMNVPASGLYFYEVGYPETFGIKARESASDWYF